MPIIHKANETYQHFMFCDTCEALFLWFVYLLTVQKIPWIGLIVPRTEAVKNGEIAETYVTVVYLPYNLLKFGTADAENYSS